VKYKFIKKGEFIYKQGEESNRFFGLITGKVKFLELFIPTLYLNIKQNNNNEDNEDKDDKEDKNDKDDEDNDEDDEDDEDDETKEDGENEDIVNNLNNNINQNYNQTTNNEIIYKYSIEINIINNTILKLTKSYRDFKDFTKESIIEIENNKNLNSQQVIEKIAFFKRNEKEKYRQFKYKIDIEENKQ